MPVIADINPNSLGPLQPIRAPQVPISIPNPLSVAPFFQGQQLMQNERRLDQQDIAMALQEKQFDLAMSDLVFRQTKEILDMGDVSVENAYNEHTSRQSSQGGSGYGSQLGLDMGYKKHVELAEKANARIGDFESKMLSGLAGTLKGGDPKGMNMLLADLSKGLIENRRALQNDPEYIKYAVQHQKFNRFLKGTAAEIAKGNSVDELQYRRTEQLYKKFADGDHLTLRETQELDELLSNSNIQAMTFNQEKGLKWLKDTIDAAAAPILEEEGIDTNDPRLPGYGIVKSKKTWADPADVMHEVVRAAAVNEDLIKMFKAATGLDIRDKKNYGAFANWVAVQAKPYLHPGGQFTSDVGAVIVDPTEVLKAKAYAENANGGGSAESGRSGSTGVFSDKTEDERAAGGYYQDLRDRGLEVISGGRTGIAAVAKLKLKNPASVIEEVDPNTGEVKIYQVQTDKETGAPIMEPDYDAKGKAIPGSDHVVKIGGPILTLGKRSTGIQTPPGGIQYQQGTVDTSIGQAVPTFQPGQLDAYRSRVASAYEKGEQNPIVRASENANQDSLTVDPQGARGRYQFHGAHQIEFLKSLGETDWKKAYDKLGAEEFAKKEDEYFNKNIRDKALEYTGQAFKRIYKNEGDPQGYDEWGYYNKGDKGEYWNAVNDYIASTANQSGDYQKIIDKAIQKFVEQDNSDPESESDEAKRFLKSLYETRVEYISNLPDSVKGPYKDKWHEVAVNRPYQDYIAALDRINTLTGEAPQQLQGTQSVSAVPASVEAPSASETAPTPVAQPDAVQTRLLSGGDFSPEELVTELQAIGEDIPGDRYVNRFGIPGPSTFSKIGEVNADLQKAQDVVSAFDVEYSVKNKIREEKGEPLLDKTQDKEYKKAVAELNKLQTYQSKLVREFAPQAKDLLIERKFPEESAESYRLYSEAIVDTLVTSIDEIDLETISDLKGSMTESRVDGSEVIIKETGKKPLRISKSELPNWVRQHARRSAFASTDPIELRRGRVEAIQQPTTTPTAPATPVPQTTGVITGSATGKKY